MTTSEQQIGALQADMSNVKADMAEMRSDMKEVRDTLAEAKGYWKMLLMIAGFAGAVGSFVTWLLSWVPSLPRH